ncbi:SDR family NAD(P)-dependent oxidoreductase, partial [Streptomyces spongiae]
PLTASLTASLSTDGPHLLTLSARTGDALRAASAELAAHLRAHPDLDEGDVCATVRTSRDAGPYRLALVADGDLADRLEAARDRGDAARPRPRTVFLLPGQGTQRPGAGRALYRSAPVFREVLDEASSLTGPVLGRSLASWCLDEDADPVALARTEVAQPLLVAFGVGLAGQLAAWGVRADAVVGHSVGEITAACVSGTLSPAEAVGFAAERGRLVGEFAAPGAMAAVRGDEDTVTAVVAASGGALCVAAVNSPAQVVLAGEEHAVERAVADLTARGVAARRLRVSHAFHSPMLDPVLDPLRNAAKTLTLHPAGTPMLSTVTGQWGPALTPQYWRDHAVRPVRFGAAVARLLDEGYDTFVELGAGDSLSGPVRAVAAGARRTTAASEVTVLPALGDGRGSGAGAGALLETVGRLWTRGVPLSPTAPEDATARGAGSAGRRRVPVPTYPFQRRRYWPERPPGSAPAPGDMPVPGDMPIPRRLIWSDTPPAAAPGPRAVRLAGADTALGRALAERLTRRGVTVLERHDAPPTAAVDTVVWLAGEATDIEGEPDAVTRTAVSSLRELTPLLGTGPTRLLVVTEDVNTTGAVAAPERSRPGHALLHGFALALPEEHPGVSSRSVDLSSRDTLDSRLDALERELYSEDMVGADGTVAWRAGRRLTRTPVAVRGGTATAQALPPDGTYLITGGAGGLGSALARDLAERGKPDLVLTGRTATPPRDLLADLRARGARARYHAVDVCDEAAVDALVAGLPPLDGVFHAAGTAAPGSLRGKPDEEIEDVLAAKVRGTTLLAGALRRHGHEDAVCVAFSSVSSVLPGLAGALGDYAAANAFLDAFAAAERAAGRPWQAIGFGPVADTGLASGTRALRAQGLTPLTPRAALAGLYASIGLDAAHVLVTGAGETEGFGADPAPAAHSRATGTHDDTNRRPTTHPNP